MITAGGGDRRGAGKGMQYCSWHGLRAQEVFTLSHLRFALKNTAKMAVPRSGLADV